MVDCRRVMADEREYVDYEIAHPVGVDIDDVTEEELPMDCESVHSRNYFPSEASSWEEAEYPLAQARNIFRDYLLLEMDLAVAYQPQNWYCYAIDVKASDLFHKRVQALAACLPNVLVVERGREYNMDSAGHHYDASILECLRLLHRPDRKWEYVSILEVGLGLLEWRGWGGVAIM